MRILLKYDNIEEECEVIRKFSNGDINLERKKGWKRFEPYRQWQLREALPGDILEGYLKGKDGNCVALIKIISR